MGSHMDAAKLDHIHLLGAQLLSLRHHGTVQSATCDIVSLQSTDLEPSTTARGVSLTASTPDTGFVTWSGAPPVMSVRVKPPPLAASSEPVLPRASQLDYERTVGSLRQTVADQNARIAALEQKLGDLDELVARCSEQSLIQYIN